MKAPRKRGRARAGLVACAVVLLLGACSADSSSTSGTSAAPGARDDTETLVVLGSDLTIGVGLDDPLREAWPYLYFAHAFPAGTNFVNSATSRATVAAAELEQEALIDQTSADVVAILLGTDDVLLQTPIDAFEDTLSRLVNDANDHGEPRVLLAEIPAVGVDAAAIAPYNAAINRVAQTFEFVELVELGTVTVSTFPDHPADPDVAGQAAIARAFVQATKQSAPSS